MLLFFFSLLENVNFVLQDDIFTMQIELLDSNVKFGCLSDIEIHLWCADINAMSDSALLLHRAGILGISCLELIQKSMLVGFCATWERWFYEGIFRITDTSIIDLL